MSIIHSLLLVIVSFILVAFGQPAWVSWLSPLAASIGYAIFWHASLGLPFNRKKRVVLAILWFTCVQLIQLSWMTSVEYQGYYILVVYVGLALWLGLLFGLLTFCLMSPLALSWLRIGALAGMWTLLEWVRYHILCGFSWNPAGMALATYSLSMQMAAFTGVLGLSFWVMLTNLVGLREMRFQEGLKGRFCMPSCLGIASDSLCRGFFRWMAVALFPYIFGAVYFAFHMQEEKVHQEEDNSSFVALVQTGLLPSQKIPLEGRAQDFLSPWIQWKRIFLFLLECQKQKPSLIILPEYAIPFLANQPIYDFETATALLQSIYGRSAIEALPPLRPPFGELRISQEEEKRYFVSNAFFSQFLANFFQAEVVIGMDDKDEDTKRNYSAGLYFKPGNHLPARYEKQVLVPLAEYLPFEWCRSFVKSYGIVDFFTHGKEAKVFGGEHPFSVSICYEETFPALMREGRAKGAKLFINLTNDNWYPDSKLAKQHFDHGRLRAIENGVPLLRACNSGITAIVNARGQIIDQLHEEKQGVLCAKIPRYHFSTPYTRYGDSLIVGSCLGLIIGYGLFTNRIERLRRKRAILSNIK